MLNAEHVGKVLLDGYDTVKIIKIDNTSNGEWYFGDNNQLYNEDQFNYILQNQKI